MSPEQGVDALHHEVAILRVEDNQRDVVEVDFQLLELRRNSLLSSFELIAQDVTVRHPHHLGLETLAK